jgi:uncharacterized protein
MAFDIRNAGIADYPELLSLNESCVPNVNSIGRADIAFFHQYARQFVKVVENNKLAGFVIALTSGLAYESTNYRWFSRELDDFLYIDRIMVHPHFRKRGVATILYKHLALIASEHNLARLCCEVNLVPPNPDSLALHHGLGFIELATQKTECGTKEVSLLVKELRPEDA